MAQEEIATDYQKVDAGLAAALHAAGDRGEPAMEVFIHVGPSCGSSEIAFLECLGVRMATSGQRVLTAKLSPRAVAELSDQPWVQQLRLSRKLRLLAAGQ